MAVKYLPYPAEITYRTAQSVQPVYDHSRDQPVPDILHHGGICGTVCVAAAVAVVIIYFVIAVSVFSQTRLDLRFDGERIFFIYRLSDIDSIQSVPPLDFIFDLMCPAAALC